MKTKNPMSKEDQMLKVSQDNNSLLLNIIFYFKSSLINYFIFIILGISVANLLTPRN